MKVPTYKKIQGNDLIPVVPFECKNSAKIPYVSKLNIRKNGFFGKFNLSVLVSLVLEEKGIR